MKFDKSYLYIGLYFLIPIIHYFILEKLNVGYEDIFTKYYMFLTLLFVMLITVLSIVKRIYPDYIGFAFLGLIMLKLTLMFIAESKLKVAQVPDYKFHFIIPYLISLVVMVFYAIELIKQSIAEKDEKNQ